MNHVKDNPKIVEVVDPAKYDRLKPWRYVKEEIIHALEARNPEDETITLSEGFQVIRDIWYPNPLKFVMVMKGSRSVLTAFRRKSLNVVVSHKLEKEGKEIDTEKSEIAHWPLECIYISFYNVFVCFCADLSLRVFSNIKQGFKELSHLYCLSTVQTLAYNYDTDEIIGGGPGFLLRWSMAEFRKSLILVGGFENLKISRDTWIKNVKIFLKNKVLTVLTEGEVICYNYATKSVTFQWLNRHKASLSQVLFYRPLDYLITAACDGTIKIANSLLKVPVHDFRGHSDTVTAMSMHPTQSILLSCSLDGSIRVWYLEIFEMLYCWYIGEPLFGMQLLDSKSLVCWTNQSIKFFSLNLHLRLFASRQSEVIGIKKTTWGEKLGRIIVTTEDGSISLLSPATGSLITSVYPSIVNTFSNICHAIGEERLYTLPGNGKMMAFDTSCNPCQPIYKIVPTGKEDTFLCLALLNFIVLLYSEDFDMVPLQAHERDLVVMDTCNDAFDGLLTGGVDNFIRVWRCLVDKKIMTLALTAAISCRNLPPKMAMLRNVLLYYSGSLLKMKRICENMHVKAVYLLPEDKHTGRINGLSACSSLELIVTTASDGFVKIWNIEGHLVRELTLDSTLNGVTFANNRGDIIVGYRGQLYSLSIVEYLPFEELEAMEHSTQTDGEREEPLETDLSLRTWVSFEELKSFPPEAALIRNNVTKVKKITNEEVPPPQTEENDVIDDGIKLGNV